MPSWLLTCSLFSLPVTHWKRPWLRERLKIGEGDDRGWDDWMASLTQWKWIWANPKRQWMTGKPGVLQSMGLQRVTYNWETEQQQQIICWTKVSKYYLSVFLRPDSIALLSCLQVFGPSSSFRIEFKLLNLVHKVVGCSSSAWVTVLVPSLCTLPICLTSPATHSPRD